MISLLFKHSVVEWCIDHFFNNLNKNFSISPKIAVNDKFKNIVIHNRDLNGNKIIRTYENCEIKAVYTAMYLGDDVTIFNFTTEDGDLLMGCTYYSTEFIR